MNVHPLELLMVIFDSIFATYNAKKFTVVANVGATLKDCKFVKEK